LKKYYTVVARHGAQFRPPFPATISRPTCPSPPPHSTPFLVCFSVLTFLAHFLFFFTLHPHTSQSTSILFIHFFHSSIPFCSHETFPCEQGIHYNPLCPLHLQHCFFSTSSTKISPHTIPCFLVCNCFPQFLLERCSHTPCDIYSSLEKASCHPFSCRGSELTIKCPYSVYTHKVIISQKNQ